MRDPRSKIITLAAAVQWRSALRRDGKTLAATALIDGTAFTDEVLDRMLEMAGSADALLVLTSPLTMISRVVACFGFVHIVIAAPTAEFATIIAALNPDLIDFTLASFRSYEVQQSNDAAARQPLPTESATAAPAAVRKEASLSELPSGTVCAVPAETAEATHAVSVQPLSSAAGGAS